MNSKSTVLFTSLQDYFKDQTKIQKLIDIRDHIYGITPRFLDWFVVHYSRKHPIYVNGYHIYELYKNAIKSYGKDHFDPFCRKHKVVIQIFNDALIQTSISQLNFIRWAIDTKIIDFIEHNLQMFITEMLLFQQQQQQKQPKVKKRKQHQ